MRRNNPALREPIQLTTTGVVSNTTIRSGTNTPKLSTTPLDKLWSSIDDINTTQAQPLSI